MNADEIKNKLKNKFRIKAVPMPELGDGEVLRVRSLDARRDNILLVQDYPLDATGTKATNNRLGRDVRWVTACLCDEDGNYLYTQADESEIASWSSDVVARLYVAAREVNGDTAVEEAERKNE